MRVLLVSNTYPPDLSGVASLVQEMARQLDAEGHDVVVLTRDNADRKAPESFLDTLACGKGSFPWFAARRYWRLASQEPFDLVHVHESDGGFLVFAHALLRRLRRPAGQGRLVATLQVSYAEERRQIRPVVARHGTSSVTVSRPTAAEKKSRRRALIHAFFGRCIVRLADRIVAPSHETAKELVADYGARDVAVVYNGIDVDEIPRARVSSTNVRHGRVRILYAGRLRTRKAVAVLLLAFRQILDDGLDAELRIVGGGEQEEDLILDASARFAEDLERVRFLGALSRDATLQQYAEADIYCLPSLYEGFPLAILEAMAAGLPVVATTVSGNPEAIQTDPAAGEVTGLLVPPRDVDQLAAALSRLVRDPTTRQAMGEAGRRRVAEHFAIDKIVGDYARLWENLIQLTTTEPNERT